MKIFTPTLFENCVMDIDLQMLKDKGIKLLLLDIDNTLVPTSVKQPTQEIDDWFNKVKSYGIDICFISNNSRKRVEGFNIAKHNAFHRAYKPLVRGFESALKKHNIKKEQACFVGDQIFTDIWGANRAKIMSILVNPLSDDEGSGIKFKRKIEIFVLRKIKPMQFALIGNPVKHSRSPQIHTEVYKKYGINAKYTLYEPKQDELEKTINYFKKNGIKGFNITVPYKQQIMQFIDVLSEDAKQIGAVNTVKIENNVLYGYNTDGDGFINQLKADNTEIKGKNIKIVGSGGATPSIVYALIKNGAKSIIIYNRTVEKASAIAKNYKNVFAKPLDEFSASDCEILINTTSVGLESDKSPVENVDGISKETVVYDLIYSPPVTAFMQMAIDKGCKAYNGYKMLVYQGLLADEIWFDRKDITI